MKNNKQKKSINEILGKQKVSQTKKNHPLKFLFKKKIDWQLIQIWWPIFLQLFMLPLFAWLNNIVVGHLGEAQLAGVSIGYNYLNAVLGLFYFLTIITTSSVSFYKGAKKMGSAMETALDSLIIATILGLTVTIILEIFTKNIVKLFNANESVSSYTVEFARYWTLALTPIMIVWASQGILKGLQKVKIIARTTIITIILELILNVIFVFGFKTGLKGLGYGCTIANTVAAIMLLTPIMKDVKKAKIKNYRFKIKYIKGFIAESIPLSLRSVFMWFGILCTIFAVANLGEQYIAAMHICDSIFAFSMFTFDALASASQTLIGEARGAMKPKKIINIINRTKRTIVIFIIPVSLIIILLSFSIPRLTINDKYIFHLVIIACIFSVLTVPIHAFTFTYDGIVFAFKKYKYLMFATFFSMLIGVSSMLISMHTITNHQIRFLFVFISYDIVFILPRFIFNQLKIKSIKKTILTKGLDFV